MLWENFQKVVVILISHFLLGSAVFAADDHGLSDQLSADAQILAPAFIVPVGPAPTLSQRNQVGLWGPVINWTPHIPVTAATLPDGRLLTFASNQRTMFPVGAEFTYAAVWNPQTGVFTEINNPRHDMFCGGTAFLPDGRLVINGGRNVTRLSSIFDWRTNQWSAIANMNDGRWYNTSVAMTDGSVFTVTGDGGKNTAEQWTAAEGWRRLTGINWAPIVAEPGYVTNWHPLMVVAPDGRLFHGGPTRKMNWVTTTGNGSVTYSNVNVPGTQFPKEGSFAMYDEGQILVAGGSLNPTPNPRDSSTGTSTNLAFTIDIRTGTPVVRQATPMKYVRQFANSVILPNGEVMVIGGNTSGLKFNDTGSILAPEIWNPTTGQWREVTDMSVPRNYHSVALLLPDGRVWSGGGGLSGNSADHRDAQIYTPPMLYAANGDLAVRPVLTQAPGYIGTGTVFTIRGTPGIQRFTFIKMSSQTHAMNTDLRFLNLPFTEVSPGVYSVTSHSNLNVMTPGYWMLFGIAANGVYSESKVIQVDPSTNVTITNPGNQLSAINAITNVVVYGRAPNSGAVTYSATNLPPGLAIHTQTGIISGQPTTLGDYTPNIRVTDGITAASTTFTWTITAANTNHQFTTFSGSNSSLQLNGSGTVNGSVLQLTPNTANLTGTAFLKTPVPISANTSFTTRFVFRMNGLGDGADGMTFMLQNNSLTALGSPGGGLAYEGISQSLAIELDTYLGGSDPNGNHIGVLTNGVVSSHLATYNSPFDLENGSSHTLWAEYDGVTNTLRVYLAQGVVTTRPATAVITLANVDLPQLLGPNAWIGFSGATGGSSNTHEVLSWSFFSNAFALPSAPVITSPGALTHVQGLAVHQPITATDLNQDPLTFSATGLPPGLTINASSGVITGTPTTAGNYSTTLTVNDGNSAAVSTTFAWRINSRLTLQPLITTAAAVNTAITFVQTGTGGANPRYRWNFGNGSATTAYSSNPQVTYTYNAAGRYLVTLTATDDSGVEESVSAYQIIHPPLTQQKPTQSSSILVEKRSSGNDRVWVVNPDNNSVTIFDAVTRAKLGETTVGTAPRSVAIANDGRVWVTNMESATISILNGTNYTVVSTISLPRGSRPFGLTFHPNSTAAYVVLEATGQLLRLNSSTGATLSTLAVGAHARHVSISADGTRVYVSRFISPPVPDENTATPKPAGKGGEVVVINGSTHALERTIILQHSDAPDSPTSASGIPNYLGAVAISPDGLSAWVPSKQDNIKRGTLRNGVGLNHDQTLRAIASHIDLASQSENLAKRVDFDNAGIPTAAVFDPSGGYLFVALESSRSVAVMDARSHTEIMRFSAGRAPQGLTLSPDGATLYVQNFMDRSVTIHDVSGVLKGGTALPTPIATVSTVSTEKLTPQLLLGKQLFYDALDTRVALQEYISCAGCHNDGGSDGRTWDLTGFGEGLRNTITLRGHGNAAMLHWSGNFDEVQDFEGQIRNLAGGTGLMSDAHFNAGTRSQPLGDPKAGVSSDLDALAAYVKSLTTEPNSPFRNNDGSLTAAAVEGEKIFREQNCASCHSGTRFSNSALNVFADIGTRKPASGKRLNGALTGFNVPTLRGVWATGPYLHDGSASTLAEAVRAHQGVTLNDTELAQMSAYLQQLDSAPTTAPLPVTATLASTAPATVTGAFTVSVTFSHPVTGFVLNDITVTGGTASALTGSGSSYQFTVTPTANVAISLAAKVAQDSAGVGNIASPALTRLYNSPAPVLVGQDIGNLAVPGFTQFNAATGTYTLTASGHDIFFENDEFHFTKVMLNGNGEIRARVRSFGNVNPWAKAGVMIRENLTAGSRHGMMFITPPGAENGFGMVARYTAGASTEYNQGPAMNPAPNNWVRLVRVGNALTGYASADGQSWTQVTQVSLAGLPNQIFIGLAATSGRADVTTTAVFDEVQIIGEQSVLPPEAVLSAASSTETGAFTVNAQFSQAVTGLTLSDFVVTNAVPSNLTGSGQQYQLTLTPTTPGAVTISLPAGSVVNAGAVANTGSNTVSVTYAPPIATTLQGQDIGGVYTAGSTSLTGGVYTLKGSGDDIFFNSDGFQFALTQLTGDGEIRARVTSQTNLNPWAKAGVMVREDLSAGSRHSMMFTTPTSANNGFGSVWRSAPNATTNYAAGPNLNPTNNWVRLVRVGNNLTSYASTDGTTWVTVNTVTLSNLPASVYVGLALTSGSTQLSTATFDNVQIVGSQGAVAPQATLTSGSSIVSGPFTVQGQFTQDVVGLTLSDFVVSNGSPSNLTGSGKSYSLTITPTQAGAVSIQLPAAAAQNGNGVPSVASNQLQVSYAAPVTLSLQSEDIGNAAAAGSLEHNAATDVYTLRGSGEDIFFAEDGFHFGYTQLIGNGEIRARVMSQTNQNPWGKAGVMFRESLAGGSRHVMMFTTPMEAGNGFGTVIRATTNATTAYEGGPNLNAVPNNWVRISRQGNTFTTYASANGTTWTQVSTVNLELPTTLYVGLAVSSARVSQLCTATFDQVQIVGTQTTPPAAQSSSFAITSTENSPPNTPTVTVVQNQVADENSQNLLGYALNRQELLDDGWWLTSTAEGRVDAHLVRARTVTDVRYQLESSADLKTWQALALAPTVTGQNAEVEQITWAGISHVSGQSIQRGIVRLRVTHSNGLAAVSAPQTWQRHQFSAGTQTVGVSWVHAPIFAGVADQITTGNTVTVQATLPGVMLGQSPCYVEVLSGTHAGHRFEVKALAGQVITLDVKSVHSTQSVLPQDLAGAQIVIRPHVTLSQVFPKASFQGAYASTQADQVLFYESGKWQTQWLELNATRHEWRSTNGATADHKIIAPGTGVMIKLTSAASPYTVTGHVRSGKFIGSVAQAHQLLSLPWPVDSKAEAISLDASHGLTAAAQDQAADQIQLWAGDRNAEATEYDVYWLNTQGAWTLKSQGSSTGALGNLTLSAQHAFFLKTRPKNTPFVWQVQSPGAAPIRQVK